MNRVKWDLRYDSPRLIALRTVAPDNPHIWDEPRFRDSDSRPITHWGTKPAEVGPIVAPGKYTVRLKVDDQTYTTAVTVLADPRTGEPEKDIDLSVATLLRIRDDISHVSDTVNQIEWIRKQLEVVEAMLRPPKKKEDGGRPHSDEEDYYEGPGGAPAPPAALTEAEAKRKADLLKTCDDFDKKLLGIEDRLVSRALLNSDDKYFVEPYKLYLNLIWLNASVGTGGGDVAGGADFAPTDSDMDLLKTFEGKIAGVDGDYQNFLKADLPAFNKTLSENNSVTLVAQPK
jgi:hypothetical protein